MASPKNGELSTVALLGSRLAYVLPMAQDNEPTHRVPNDKQRALYLIGKGFVDTGEIAQVRVKRLQKHFGARAAAVAALVVAERLEAFASEKAHDVFIAAAMFECAMYPKNVGLVYVRLSGRSCTVNSFVPS